MRAGRRLATVWAITATTALAGAGAAAATPLPPKGATFPGIARAKAAPAPAVPTFVNGMAQAVFSTNENDWVNHELWVEVNADSDGDGRKDRVHVDVSRPRETDSDGLKVPVIFEDSPYYAGGADITNWAVDHPLGTSPASRIRAPDFEAGNTSPVINRRYESTWVPRGFAVVHSESVGSGNSTGCPNSGAPIETLGATAVIDWLTGRAKGYTTRNGTDEVSAYWTNGNVGMMGTSYNGTIPIAAASTGVQGLKAIVPISAISDWYDYYRANGMVRAPHSNIGGTGTNGFLGEDLDVLTEYIYSRNDEGPHRTICWPQIDSLKVNEDRASGNRSALWQERNYMKDAGKINAAVLIAHGGNDFNVMTKNAAQLYASLKAQNKPRMFYFHQGGHGGAPPDFLLNLWFTKYLWGQDNGAENLPKSWVVRNEPGACPPRQTTVAGAQSNTTTLTVAGTAPFRVGTTLTVPQANPDGTVATVTRVITNIPDATHLTLDNPVATGAGQSVANGAVVFLACDNANPTPYPEWPDPATADATLKLTTGGFTRGGLTFAAGSAATETLTDDASIADTTLRDAASSPNRLVYQTLPLTQAVRISGTPKVTLNVAFDAPKANLSAALISYPASGAGTILTRGWVDPENRNSDFTSDPITPGTFYRITFDMQAKDAVVPAGQRLALMVFSSDREYTIRPPAGTHVTLDLAGSSFTIPVVGGPKALATATGGDLEDLPVSGDVPPTLSLTLGAMANLGTFTPGVARDYFATTTSNVISTAGNATMTVMDADQTNTGKLVNGAFSLAQPLQIRAVNFSALAPLSAPVTLRTYSGPVSKSSTTLEFKQSIGANEPLRTGTYSKTLTFTLSTTEP